MCKRAAGLSLLAAILIALSGCRSDPREAGTVTFLIESSPASLDPRIGTDAQAEHIDELLFDSLVHKRADFGLEPWIAASWDTPDPLTFVFHLRTDVKFHNGQPLTARDVKWTLDSVRDGTVITAKAGTFRTVDRVDAPDPATVIVHLKRPDASLLWNLSDGAIGIVPYGSGRDFQQHPIGSGPFRFVSQQIDKEVVIERNGASWQAPPQIERVRFSVVPDAITRALELRKGSADVAVNALTADMVYSLRNDPQLAIERASGTPVQYLTFNLTDPILKDERVRRAIALAIDRNAIIHALWRDTAQPAQSLLPRGHWAYSDAAGALSFEPAQARAILDNAGYHTGADGVRFHISLKTSTDESTRLLAAILQQQLRQVGIALDIRSFEFATFYADITHGAFQMYGLRWLGGNEDPDIFRYAFASSSFPPKGANRGHYTNPALDTLVERAGAIYDQAARRQDYVSVQRILAEDLPALPLWYLDTVVIHQRRLTGVEASRSGTFDFLRTATLLR
jgi:peptide/nickel transport system substrate-binding protein